MFDRLLSEKAKISIGVPLDDRKETLVSFCEKFFEESKSEFRLINAVDSLEFPFVATYPGEYLFEDISKRADQKKVNEHKQQLKKFACELRTEKTISTNVLSGHPPEAIKTDVDAEGSNLIIVGSSPKSHKFIPKGLSTALGLMANSKVPVMVVPDTFINIDVKKPMSILVCDDLTESSAAVLRTGLDFMPLSKGSMLTHIHICKSNEKELRDYADQIMEKMNLDYIPYNENISIDSFVNETESRIKKALKMRIGNAGTFIEEYGAYNQDVYFGDFFENLTKAVNDHQPDVILFGRHETLHTKPFSVGKLPFYAMLSFGLPVVVVPKETIG